MTKQPKTRANANFSPSNIANTNNIDFVWIINDEKRLVSLEKSIHAIRSNSTSFSPTFAKFLQFITLLDKWQYADDFGNSFFPPKEMTIDQFSMANR